MRNLVHYRHNGRWALSRRSSAFRRRRPSWIEQLREVNEGEALRAFSSCSKVEDDGCLHGSKERISCLRCTVVEEVRLVDASIFRLSSRLADDPRIIVSVFLLHLRVISRTSPPCPSLQ